jgi:hypothetical protein
MRRLFVHERHAEHRHESDVGRIATHADANDIFGVRHACRIDQVPASLKPDFDNGMKIRRLDLERIGGDKTRGNRRRAGEACKKVREIAAHATTLDKGMRRSRIPVRSA